MVTHKEMTNSMQFKEALKRKGFFRKYVRSTFRFGMYLDLKTEYGELKYIVTDIAQPIVT